MDEPENGAPRQSPILGYAPRFFQVRGRGRGKGAVSGVTNVGISSKIIELNYITASCGFC